MGRARFEGVCTLLSQSRSKMITNRMYGSMCGSRASEPSSRSRLSAYTIRARMVGTGVSERGARWLVVELCARELPALPLGTAQRLLPVRLAIWSCRPAPSAARLDALPTTRRGGPARRRTRGLSGHQTPSKCGARASNEIRDSGFSFENVHFFVMLGRTQMPLKVSAGSRAPASSGKTGPPAPSR